MVVHLDRPVERQRLVREEQDVAGLVDDDRLGLSQALPRAQEHLARRAGERGIVDADQKRDGELALERSRDGVPFEEPNGPLHTRDAAYARQVRILEGVRLFPVLRLRIHDPDFGIGDV